ncbi:hypothetical protein GNP78_11960 [Aliivibrio fischeri]|nr:hypothetical protein [Aliivibrio fischeri]
MADVIPDDFRAMYDYKEKNVTVVNVEGKRTQLSFFVNYNTVKIRKKQTEVDFRYYLSNLNVKEKTIDDIIYALKNDGISNSSLCIGAISECIVDSKSYDFVYDFDKNKLYIFFSPTVLLDIKEQKRYVNNKNKDTAVINHVDSYLSANTNSTLLSVNDLTSIGLKYGYLSSDITLSLDNKSANEIDLNKFAYNIDFSAYQLQVGWFDNNMNTNATDVLFDKDNTKDMSIHFGTSKNLLENSERYYKRINFYAPSSGAMTIYKDGRIIRQYTVNAGAGSIPYSELPAGRYDVRIEIISNGIVSLDQTYPVYNTGDNKLSPQESSFMISAGIYKESSYIQYDNESSSFEDKSDLLDTNNKKIIANDFDDSFFLRGLYSYQLNNNVMLGGGVTAAKNNNLVGKMASKLLLPLDSDITFLYSNYKEGARSQTVNFNSRLFSLNYENYKHVDGDIFAEYLQGKSSRESLSINTSYNISKQLSGQSGYSYGNNGGDLFIGSYDYWSLNSSLNYQFSGGNLFNLNMMYTNYGDNSSSDSLEVTLNLTIPLSENLSATSSLYTQDGKVSQFTNGLETSDLIENEEQNLQFKIAQSNYNNRSVSEITTYGNASGKGFDSNVYGYADTAGERYINAGFSSSQVITENRMIITNKKSDSYLLVDVNAEDESIDNLGLLSIKRNEKNDKSSFIYNDEMLIPLDKYESYQGEIDTESVSLENYGDKSFTGFSFPGSTYKMDVNVGKVITFVATFEDLFSNTVEDIKCQGMGCVNIIPVTDGVFKVAVREGQEFILRSKGMVCLTPGVKNIKSLNLGQNYCVPYMEGEGNNEFRLADRKGNDKSIYYIGKFKDTVRSKETYSIFNKEPYKIIEKKIEDYLLVYVTVNDDYQITENDKQLFNDILVTAGNDSGLVSPVVLVLDDSWR